MTTATRVAERFKTGMKDLTPEELPPAQQALVKKLGLPINNIQGGHAGIVIAFKNTFIPRERLDKALLKTLASDATVRGVEVNDRFVSIGC